MPLSPSRSGFTMVELMIVIGVIAVLTGLLIPAIGIVQQRSQVTKTVSIIANIDAAIAKQIALGGSYPDHEHVTHCYCSIDKTLDPQIEDEYSQARAITNGEHLYTSIKEVASETFNRNSKAVINDSYIADVWGQPIVYRPATKYPWDPNAQHIINGDSPPNDSSYQLWSTGYDKRNNHGVSTGIGDDINNW